MKIVNLFLKIILIVSTILLLAGYLNSLHPLLDSISHFRIHIAFIVATVALILLIINRNLKYILLVVLSIAIYFYHNYRDDVTISDNVVQIKHLQFNMNFRNKQLQKLDKFLKDDNVDIVTLQEVTKDHWEHLNSLKDIYPYQRMCNFYPNVGGVAILSKYPFVGEADCVNESGLLVSTVNVNGINLTVASVHLFWPYPYNHHEQITQFSNRLKQIKDPAIISGDFNAAPWSNAVNRVSNYSNTKVTKGLRWTISLDNQLPYFPIIKLPIDQLLVSKGVKVKLIEAKEHFGSDHYGVLDYLYIEN